MLLSLFWSKAQGQSTGLRSLGGPCVLPSLCSPCAMCFCLIRPGGCGGLRGHEVREAGVESNHWGNVLRGGKYCVSVTEQGSSFSLHPNKYKTLSGPLGPLSKVLLTVPLFTPSEKAPSACPCLLTNAEGLQKAVLQTQLAFSCLLFYCSRFSAGQSCNNDATALRTPQETVKKSLFCIAPLVQRFFSTKRAGEERLDPLWPLLWILRHARASPTKQRSSCPRKLFRRHRWAPRGPEVAG